MKRRIGIGLIGTCLAVVVHQSSAIATANLSVSEDLPSKAIAPYNTFNWDYMYKYKNASSAAVDHYWIITAGHVADDTPSGNLNIGGETFIQQETVFHPTADLALVRYDKPLPGYYLLSDSIPIGDEVVLCGYGFSGNVVSTGSSAYFTDSGSGNGVKRWGSNRIDNDISYIYEAPGPLGWTTNLGFEVTISTANPNDGKTLYESGGNVYDSGAGLFHTNGSNWELVGTMTTRTNNGFNYTGNFAVGTKYYVDWIKSVIVDYDTDMDSLPDWWEIQHGGDATSMVATNDLDEDHFSNYEEWIADTNPTNGSSFFNMGIYTNVTTVVFTSSTNRKYQIQSRTDLSDTNEVWQTEVDWFTGLYPQTITNVSASTSNRFYRVRAKLR